MKVCPSVLKKYLLFFIHPWLWRVHVLRKADLSEDPFTEFERWFCRAQRCFWLALPEAVCLSTVDLQGLPDGRMVLLKSFDRTGFVFYTNGHSVKGRSLELLPQATLTFYWEALQRQIRVQGKVEMVSSEEADNYFATRARMSQIGAWASAQSEPLASREELQQRVAEFKAKFKGHKVPRPPHWCGYRVIPSRIEFWQIRPNRLHDRFVYLKRSDSAEWELIRLNP